MGHCSGYSAVNRNHLGQWAWHLGHRTGFNDAGGGIHGGRHAEHFNQTFLNQCDKWATNLNKLSQNNGGRTIDWIGDVGVGVCKSGMHGQARAFDLTHLRFTNGHRSDMNRGWRLNLAHKRRYLAIAAQCRRHFGTVLTAWYNDAHKDHIHFDNGTAVGPIRDGSRSDVTLVQASCNILNGDNMAIDGQWGPVTQDGFVRLRRAFRLGCTSPRANKKDAVRFLKFIVRHGFANKPAGTFKAGVCS